MTNIVMENFAKNTSNRYWSVVHNFRVSRAGKNGVFYVLEKSFIKIRKCR